MVVHWFLPDKRPQKRRVNVLLDFQRTLKEKKGKRYLIFKASVRVDLASGPLLPL